FHQVSSIAASGDYRGFWDETMFDVDQGLPSPYHRTKFESEKIVREESAVPWRVYCPSMVIGHSETGAMDKVDGPYYFFPILKSLRDFLPAWTPLVGVDLGDTNVVPVDYVVSAMDHLAHLEGRDGEAFHLVNPEPQPVAEMINALCAGAGAAQFATPIDRGRAGGLLQLVPGPLKPLRLAGTLLRTAAAQAGLGQTARPVWLPREGPGHVII